MNWTKLVLAWNVSVSLPIGMQILPIVNYHREWIYQMIFWQCRKANGFDYCEISFRTLKFLSGNSGSTWVKNQNKTQRLDTDKVLWKYVAYWVKNIFELKLLSMTDDLVGYLAESSVKCVRIWLVQGGSKSPHMHFTELFREIWIFFTSPNF